MDYLDDCNCSPSRTKKWSVYLKRGKTPLNDPGSPNKLVVRKSASVMANP